MVCPEYFDKNIKGCLITFLCLGQISFGKILVRESVQNYRYSEVALTQAVACLGERLLGCFDSALRVVPPT